MFVLGRRFSACARRSASAHDASARCERETQRAILVANFTPKRMTAPAFAGHYAELSRSLGASDWPSARSALSTRCSAAAVGAGAEIRGAAFCAACRTSAEKSRTPGLLLAAAHAQYAGALALQPGHGGEAAAELASLGDELVRHSLLAAARPRRCTGAAALGRRAAAAWLRLGEWLYTADDGQHAACGGGAATGRRAAPRAGRQRCGAAPRRAQQHRRGKWSAATKAYARCIGSTRPTPRVPPGNAPRPARRPLVIAEATLRPREVQGGGGGGGGGGGFCGRAVARAAAAGTRSPRRRRRRRRRIAWPWQLLNGCSSRCTCGAAARWIRSRRTRCVCRGGPFAERALRGASSPRGSTPTPLPRDAGRSAPSAASLSASTPLATAWLVRRRRPLLGCGGQCGAARALVARWSECKRTAGLRARLPAALAPPQPRGRCRGGDASAAPAGVPLGPRGRCAASLR